nr:hypothetical protein GCM10020093_009950 [Planobispora longispora]
MLCFTLHHIVADGSSLNVLLDDLAACYTARVRGREPRLRPLPVQPSDYARWQRRRVERAVPYWQGNWPIRPRPSCPSTASARTSGRGTARSTTSGWTPR